MQPPAELNFRHAADAMPHVMWTAAPDGTVDYINQVYTDLTGGPLDVAAQSWVAALHPDDVQMCLAAWTHAVCTGTEYAVEFRLYDRTHGSHRWHSVSAKPIRDAGGHIIKWYGVATDVHERKMADEKARLLTERFQATIDNMRDGFFMLDRDMRAVYVNRVCEQLLGLTRGELLGHVPWERMPMIAKSRVHRTCCQVAETGQACEEEYYSPIFNAWFEIKVYPLAEGGSLYFRDISARKHAEAEVERLAFTDRLTSLPNRQVLQDRLHAALERRDEHDTSAVIFLDLDNFKNLNDTQGHATGDVLLRKLAQRLQECVREGDTVARLGGDEFVILLERLGAEPAASRQAEGIAERVLEAVSRPCDLGGYQYIGTAAVGIALIDAAVHSVDEVLKRADLAMYRAKAEGRNTIRFFDPAMLADLDRRMTIEAALRESLREDLFALHYQPQADRVGNIVGLEALLRWTHPRFAHVGPATFIAVAEETGLILDLGRLVLRAACAQLARWADDPVMGGLPVSVNVSARQFRRVQFVADVLEAVQEAGVAPERLMLELTESVLIEDLEDAVAKMRALKDAGILVALDDFGTGYSSLSYLRRLPLAQVKIDRSFIRDLPGEAGDAAIVKAIVALAHDLGFSVVAEGVETQQQRALLAARGCDLYQGYLVARPAPPADIEAFMHARQSGLCLS